jgi:hypothetical protein
MRPTISFLLIVNTTMNIDAVVVNFHADPKAAEVCFWFVNMATTNVTEI